MDYLIRRLQEAGKRIDAEACFTAADTIIRLEAERDRLEAERDQLRAELAELRPLLMAACWYVRTTNEPLAEAIDAALAADGENNDDL